MTQFQTPKMNLNHIRTFVILGQSKNIYEAMTKLNMDRTNITRHIKALEKEYNTKLFNMDAKEYGLTEDGKMVFSGYEQAYNILFITEKTFKQTKNLNSGKLTIGVSRDIELDLVIDKIKEFKKIYPNVVVKTINLPTDDLYKKLTQYSMDFIIDSSIDNIGKSKNVKSFQIYKDDFCISYLKKDCSIVIKELRDLDSLPLILPTTSKKERMDFDALLNENDIIKNISLEIDNYSTILEYVKSGLGIGLLPKRYTTNDDSLINIDIPLSKDIVISYLEENISPSAKELLKVFKVDI